MRTFGNILWHFPFFGFLTAAFYWLLGLLQVLAAIDHLLAEAHSDKTLILSATIFLADMAQFPLMNQAWDTWVVPGHTPPRATVEAKLANPACLVEIKIVAAQKA